MIFSLDKLTAVTKIVGGRSSLILQKASPEFLMWTGIAGVVGAGVWACVATTKFNAVAERHLSTLDQINTVWEKIEDGTIPAKEYSETDKKKDIIITYRTTGIELLKLYGPPIGLGILSIGLIVGSNKILKDRNIALMAAYKIVDEGFKSYRARVVEEHGEEVDYAYKNGLRPEVYTDTEVDKDGKKKKITKTRYLGPYEADPNGYSQYARWFDESCREWSKTPEYNLMYLKAQQNHFNNLLQTRGHVFLNEVYDALGIPRTKAGAVVGWAITKTGDNYVDFGIFNGQNSTTRAFVNGDERTILLDFNVDGVIYDLI